VTAVATATATWYWYTATEQHNTAMLSNTSALITLPDKHCLKITRKHSPQTTDKIMDPNHTLKAYAIMWPKYIHVSFNFVGIGWIFQYIFLQSCICLQFTILLQPVIISEILSYLQNPNSTFFLIYAYGYRQHMTSLSFTLSILIKTQPTYVMYRYSYTCLP